MKRQVLSLGVVLLSFAIAGCGGRGRLYLPDFSLLAVPSTITVIAGGAAQTAAVAVLPMYGFTGKVTVTVGSLPKGVTATPTASMDGVYHQPCRFHTGSRCLDIAKPLPLASPRNAATPLA